MFPAPPRSRIVSEVRHTHSQARTGRDHFEELGVHMEQINVFEEVYADLRFPLIAVDIEKLRRALRQRRKKGKKTHFAVRLHGTTERRRAALVSSLRGLFKRIEVPRQMIALVAGSETMQRAGLSKTLLSTAGTRPAFAVYEHGDLLVWEEDSFWPFAYSTFLQQLLNVMELHREWIPWRIAEVEKSLNDAGWASENCEGIVSEFPRQLPTHLQYAMA